MLRKNLLVAATLAIFGASSAIPGYRGRPATHQPAQKPRTPTRADKAKAKDIQAHNAQVDAKKAAKRSARGHG